MHCFSFIHSFTYLFVKGRFLTNDLVAGGGDPKTVGLDEALGILPQAAEHLDEAPGQEELGEAAEPPVGGPLRIDEGALMSADAGILAEDDLEAGCRHGGLDVLVARIVDGSDEGHGPLDVIDVDLVGGVVVVEEDPVEVGELGPGLEDAVDLLEDGNLVLLQ